jgi:hypothetical protein
VQHAAVCSLPLQPSGDSILFDPWATVIWSLHSGNRISAKTTLLFSTTNSSNHTNVGFSVFLFVVFVLFVVKPSLQPMDDSLVFERYSLPSRLSILGIVSLDRPGREPKVCLGIARPSHLAICALWQDSDLHRPNPFVLSMSCMLRWSIVSVTR